MAKTLIVTFLLCVAVATDAAQTKTRSSLTTPKFTTTTTPKPTTPTTMKATVTPTPKPTTPTTMKATVTPTPKPTTPTTMKATVTPTPKPTTPKASTTQASTTTTKASTGTSATGTSPTEGSSVSPNTGSSQTNAPSTAPVTATPKPPGVCTSNPCPAGSTCEERADQTFYCLCRPGEAYIGGFCGRAKVYPGQLVWKKEFQPEMADKTSEIFQETSRTIMDEVNKVFAGEDGYGELVVLELREKVSKERATPGNIEASVQIIFDPTAEITEQAVKDKVETSPLADSFTAKSLCDPTTCDTSTSTCQPTNGNFICSCKDGYKETDFAERLCVACPSGQMLVNNECKKCDFGRTGFNCSDNTLLIVVIVCCILGALVIAALIALPFVLKKPKKKSSKRNEEDIGRPYQSHSVAKAPLSYSNGNSNDFSASVKEPTNSLANSGAPRIPRATANSNFDSRTNLEMTPSNSRQNLIPSGMNSRFNDNQDDMYSFSQNRTKNHPYEEVQPKSNPYSQNRASNPYAQIRGQTNPYYN